MRDGSVTGAAAIEDICVARSGHFVGTEDTNGEIFVVLLKKTS